MFRARASIPRPLYLVCGRKIGRMGATDRPRPWSVNKTQKKSLGRRALPPTTKREPEQLPGPLRPKKTGGARICKEGPLTAEEIFSGLRQTLADEERLEMIAAQQLDAHLEDEDLYLWAAKG